MQTRRDRRELASDLCSRSPCNVKMAAVITDRNGRVVSWGWNGTGSDGLGLHAEEHAIQRANRRRLWGAVITVAGQRRGKAITSKPCAERCHRRIARAGIARIEYFNAGNGQWAQETM